MATDKFSSRTGGSALLYLSSYPLRPDGTEDQSGNGTTVTVTIIPGNANDYNNNNYMGTAKVEIHSAPSVNKDNYFE